MTIDVTGTRVRIQGEFETTLTAFDLDRPSLMMVKTRYWLGLAFGLVAAK